MITDLHTRSLFPISQLIRVRSVVRVYPGPPIFSDSMPFYFYVLRSKFTGRFYIGHTENLTRRILQHNNNRTLSTKNRGPWTLFHSEEYPTRSEASQRER